jgi:transcriptional/translational regulatory protein YebC/TACO1
MTDNKNRATANIKPLIKAANGSFSRVMYNFVKKGLIIMRSDDRQFDKVLEQAIDLGAEDVEEADDGSFKVD